MFYRSFKIINQFGVAGNCFQLNWNRSCFFVILLSKIAIKILHVRREDFKLWLFPGMLKKTVMDFDFSC